jgi:hypothetical protein
MDDFLPAPFFCGQEISAIQDWMKVGDAVGSDFAY